MYYASLDIGLRQLQYQFASSVLAIYSIVTCNPGRYVPTRQFVIRMGWKGLLQARACGGRSTK